MKNGKLSSRGLAFLALASFVATLAYSQQAPAGRSAAGNPPGPPGDPVDPSKGASVPDDKVVIKVGDQQVTAAEIDSIIHSLNPQDQKTVAAQGKGALGDRYVQVLLLSQQALRDHLDATPDFRREEAFQRAQLLAQTEYQKMMSEIKVSPQEISQYYAAHPADFDRVDMRQVAIRVKPEGAKPDTPGLSPAEAKTRAEEIRQALAATGADPQKVAKQFAVPNVVFVDALGRNFERGQLPGDLADSVFKLKDGEISPIKETPQSVYFVQVVKHVHPELKEVSSSIEDSLHQQKIASAMGELKNKTTVWSDEDFFKAPAGARSASSPGPSVGAPPGRPDSENQAPK